MIAMFIKIAIILCCSYVIGITIYYNGLKSVCYISSKNLILQIFLRNTKQQTSKLRLMTALINFLPPMMLDPRDLSLSLSLYDDAWLHYLEI